MAIGNLKIALLCGSVAVFGTLVACGGDEEDPGNGTSSSSGGGGGDGGSSGASGNNGSSSGGSSGASSSSGGVETKGGTILLTQIVTVIPNSDPIISGFATATFAQSTDGIGGSACTTSDDGACRIVECDVTPAPDGGTVADAGAVTAPHAGDITINGGTPLTLTPKADGTYDAKTVQSRIWDTADINIKAVGATVPAFEQNLPAPGSITVTAPVFPTPPAKLTIPRNADYEVSWTGGAAGKVSVTTGTQSATKTVSVSCSFDAAGGTGTIPATALGKLAAGDASLTVGAASTAAVDAGGWAITILAASPGGSGAVTLE